MLVRAYIMEYMWVNIILFCVAWYDIEINMPRAIKYPTLANFPALFETIDIMNETNIIIP